MMGGHHGGTHKFKAIVFVALLMISGGGVSLAYDGAADEQSAGHDGAFGHGPATLEVRLTAEEMAAGGPALAVLEAERGIGPGTQLQITFPDETGVYCSANFIWSDADENLYLGTAGHCLISDLSLNGTHGLNADYDASGVVVHAALEGCRLAASTFVAGLAGCVDKEIQWVELGAVTFAIYDDVGKDFGLVEIPPELHEQVRYEMPRWGGPQGEADLEPGDTILQYGQGMGWKATPESRGRVAHGLGPSGKNGYEAVGSSTAGDSGSAVVLAREDSSAPDWEGGAALGVVTHGLEAPAALFGTLVSQAKWYVRCYDGLSIWVVPGGAASGEPEGCPMQCPAACDPFGASLIPEFSVDCTGLSCAFDASASSGSILDYAWEFGDGNQVTTGSPVVTHEYQEPGVYRVDIQVTDVEGAMASTAMILNRVQRGGLYLTASQENIPFLSIGNPGYLMADEAPEAEMSQEAYAGVSTPATSTPSYFHYDARGPIELDGDVDATLYISCDGLSVGYSPIWTVTSRLENNGMEVADADDSSTWICLAGDDVTRVDLSFADVQTSFEQGDRLTLSISVWSTNIPMLDVHFLVGSTEHPSRIEADGLTGPVW